MILSKLLQFLTPSPRIKIVLPGAPPDKTSSQFSFLYLFLIKRINRFIMPLVSGMAAKPPRNAV